MNQIGVIIVNWNTGKLLADCLQSLLLTQPLDVISDIIVIDNASSDTSVAQARAAMAQQVGGKLVSFIESTENLGFARANNLGLKKLSQKYQTDKPHVLLLNPDTKVSPTALTNLLTILDTQPKAGIVGPKLLNDDGSLQPSVRRFPTLGTLTILLLKLPRIWPKVGSWRRYLALDLNYEHAQVVDQVMGAAFLIRNTVWNQLPQLDSNYFVWFEEVDYCQRAQQAGWEVWYTPTATVTHYGGVSFNQLVGWSRVKPWLHSTSVYARNHLGLGAAIVVRLLWPVAWLLSIPASLGHIVLKQRNQQKL